MAKLSIHLILAFFSFSLILFSFREDAYAQQYKWVKGGGSDAAIQARDEQVTHMCTDDNGNVYVLALVGDYNIKSDTFFMSQAFNVGSLGLPHILFASYSCDGTMRFAKLIEARNSAVPTGIIHDKGKVYLSGLMFGDNKRIGFDAQLGPQYQSVFLSKFDTMGLYGWTKFAGPDNASVLGTAIMAGTLAVDVHGNIHQYNYFKSGLQLMPGNTTQTGNYDLKYDVNGNLLSATRLPLSDTLYFIRQVRFDQQTNISYALFGYVGPTSNRSGSYLAAYDANYNQLWLDSTNVKAAVGNFRIKSGDGIYLTGQGTLALPFTLGGKTVSNTSYATGGYSTFGKLDLSNGQARWIFHVDGSSGVHNLMDIELLPSGKLAGIGTMAGVSIYKGDSIKLPTFTWNPLLVIIDTAGNLIKHDHLTATGMPNSGMALTADKKGNLYIGGFTVSSISAPGLNPYNTTGSSDFFVMKYGMGCHCTTTAVSNFSYQVSTNYRTVQFSYSGTTPADSVVWDFGDGTATTKQSNPAHTYLQPGIYNACATVYTDCGIHKKCSDVHVPLGIDDVAMEGISVYPNPVTDKLTIEGLERGMVQLYDLTGRKLLEQQITTNRKAVSIPRLTPGSYLLQLSTADGGKKTMRIVKE